MGKRLSTRLFLIGKMERVRLIPKNFGNTMRKHFSTDEVKNYYEVMGKTKYGKKKLRSLG